MLKKYTIYGERCSGTSYLQNIMDINFDIQLSWEYGWKHFLDFMTKHLKNLMTPFLYVLLEICLTG